MPSILRTVDDLVAEVRSQLDEESQESLHDVEDILPALNRAQDYGFNILARHYEEPLLTSIPLPTTAGQQEYIIPEDCFEDRIERVEFQVGGGTYQEVRRISYRDVASYEDSTRTPVPDYYYLVGRRIRFTSPPTGQYAARVWYLRNPEHLVGVGGRILSVDSGTGEIELAGTPEGITTSTEDLTGFVNVVDGQTGEIRATLQVAAVDGEILVITDTPSTPILGRAVSPLADVAADISRDDYVCGIGGTCVPYFLRPLSNFMVQYAVAELSRKLGGDAGLEQTVLDKFEKQVERTWVGRESTRRVTRRNGYWPTTSRGRKWRPGTN